VSGVSKLSISHVDFNTVTHAGLKSYQSHPAENSSFLHSSTQIASSSSTSMSSTAKAAPFIRKRSLSPASETVSRQIPNVDKPPLIDIYVQLSERVPPEVGSVTILKALRDYHKGEPQELSFRKDDLIILVEKTNFYWWKGIIGDGEGYFPSDHVQDVDSYSRQDDPEVPPALRPAVLGRVKALLDYSASSLYDLEFCKGDIISVLDATYEDRWCGTVGGDAGWFPSNHVEALPLGLPDQQPPPSTSALTYVIAIYDYSAQSPNDLDVRKGDVIYVLEVTNKD
jgi:hypothetical protein